MIITVDLDNTITNHDMALNLLLKGAEHNRENITTAYAQGFLKTLEEEPDATETLWKLSDSGYHIKLLVNRFVTSGLNHKIVAHTTDWLDRHDIPYREILFITKPIGLTSDVYITHNNPLNQPTLHQITYQNSNLELPNNVNNWKELYAHFIKGPAQHTK